MIIEQKHPQLVQDWWQSCLLLDIAKQKVFLLHLPHNLIHLVLQGVDLMIVLASPADDLVTHHVHLRILDLC